MKTCGACHADLPKGAYSKKQWREKVHSRRCRDCIAANREIASRPSPDADAGPGSRDAGGEFDWAEQRRLLVANAEPAGAVDEEALFVQPPPTDDCGECIFCNRSTHA